MKRALFCVGSLLAIAAVTVILWSRVSVGQGGGSIEVFSDGSDGAFNPAGPTVVDLGLAATAAWNAPSPTPGRGVYDPDKWAVVFKYSSINIPSGVTITFKNHPSRAPVVWLVNGDVLVDGVVSLDGESGSAGSQPPRFAEPGPGGFRGGAAGLGPNPRGAGFGPGGWPPGNGNGRYESSYGNQRNIPLIGGSGGNGAPQVEGGVGGGAGGGAILIASSGTITINGLIHANGGCIYHCGSGGAIRLIADAVQGSGALGAWSVAAGSSSYTNGQIRIEANLITFGGTQAYTTGLPGNPALIWAPDTAPRIKVTRIGNASTGDLPVPADPRSSTEFPNADVTLLTEEPVSLRIEAQNVPTSWKVEVHVVPARGDGLRIPATYESGNDQASVWSCQLTPSFDYSAIQVRAYKP